MATIHQYGSSFTCTAEQARATLRQFGCFPVTGMELEDREGAPFRVAVVWGVRSPEVRVILEDI